MTRPPANYRLFSALLAPALLGHACRRALRDGGGDYLRARLGFIEAVPGEAPVWLHCASVGEVVTAMPLLRALRDAGLGPLAVSTNTPTGFRTALQRLPAGVTVRYLPLDRPRPVRRFLDRLRPRAALILETELWPWLYAELGRRNVPLVLVNARLSTRTLNAPGWWRTTAAWCLRQAQAVLARSEGDAAAFTRLGAPADRVRTVGDLKLAAPDETPGAITLPRPYVLAASTHEDEERRLATAWRDRAPCGHLLVIAPRHPERGEAIARVLAADGHRVARRGLDEPVAENTGVYIADTLGELTAFMAGSELVIMGGSLVRHGGQNVLEPARAGRAIVTGPHMDNFREATSALIDAGALQRCDDVDALMATVVELLGDPATRSAMGERGAALLECGRDIPQRYVDALSEAVR